MYEFRAKTPTQYDFMSKVSPSRFEAKSSRKMDSSSPQKGESFLSPYLLFLCPLLLLSFSSTLFSNKEKGGLGVAAILMRSCFVWLVITEWLSPLLVKDVFCFWTQMSFLHGHEGISDWTSKRAWAYRERPQTSYLSICGCTIITLLNLLDRSICEIRKEGEEMKGERVRIVISISTLK